MLRRRAAGVAPAGSWDFLAPLVLTEVFPAGPPSPVVAVRSSEPAGVRPRAADFLGPPALELPGASDLEDFRTGRTGAPPSSAFARVPPPAGPGPLAGSPDVPAFAAGALAAVVVVPLAFAVAWPD